MPDLEDQDVEVLSRAIQQLAADRRIKASTQAVLVGMLAAVSQGSCPQGLPKPQAWVEPESEEEPEEPEEEAMASIGVSVGGAGSAGGAGGAGGASGASEAEYDERVVEEVVRSEG